MVDINNDLWLILFLGDGCIDKPLATLWKNHIGTDKPNIVMKVTVCGSGLKAVTKEHGLTEYWANRITYSAADPAYPKVFCWIYRYKNTIFFLVSITY